MQNHAVELARAGITVTAHGIRDSATDLDAQGWGNTPQYAGKALWTKFAWSPEIDRSLQNVFPNIVHQHGIWQYPSLAALKWRKRTGGKVIISPHGMLEPWALSNASIKKRIAAHFFEWDNLSQSDVIHCVSEAEVEHVRTFGLSNDIALIPNGTRLPDTASPAVNRPRDEDPRILLFLGRLHAKKGLMETLEAWARVKARAPHIVSNWRLVIAGWDDGDHAQDLLSCAQRLGVSEQVCFRGPVFGHEKEELLRQSSGFILSSFSEGFPVAILEAWAHSLPVFMTDNCNIPAGFDAGAALRISTNPDEQAEVLIKALQRRDLPSIGQKGYMLVRDRYLWPQVVDNLADVYRWVLGRGPVPDCVQFA